MSPSKFFKSLSEVAQFVDSGEPSLSLERLSNHLKDPVVLREFLSMLSSPDWIRPLDDQGYFSAPPGVEQLSNGAIRSPSWPQSKYLVRMSSKAPKEVSEVLGKLETRNWTIVADIVRAAMNMPDEEISRMAIRLRALVPEVPMGVVFYDEIGQLIDKQAVHDSQGALMLAQAVFGNVVKVGSSESVHDYSFFKGLDGHVIPSLVSVDAGGVLALVKNLLLDSLAASKRSFERDEYSYTWRPAIEPHPQNSDRSRASKLVDSLRQVAEESVGSKQMSLGEVLDELSQPTRQVLRRMQIHLLAEFGDQDEEQTREMILDRSTFDNYVLKHEYSRLVGKQWPLLTEEEQSQWLQWIKNGPMASEHDEGVQDRRREYWQFQHLHWIRPFLSGEWKDFYRRMLEEHGEPELSDLNEVVATLERSDDESPISIDDLESMGLEAAIDFVSKWQPEYESRWDGPSKSGLRGTFSQLISRHPEEFSKQSLMLRGRESSLVYHFVDPLRRAVKDGRLIDLEAVLSLGQWVVQQEDVETDAHMATWQWCRDALADLIEEACKSESDGGDRRFGIEFSDQMLELLRGLLDVPPKIYVSEPTDPRTADWAMVVLNSARGKAMQAVMAFAEWHATLLGGDFSVGAFDGGFDRMAGLRALLDEQLDRPDPDFSERAGFGLRLGLLRWIDRAWTEDRAPRIFDLEVIETAPKKAFGWAAWTTFLSWTRPHRVFYELLRDQYSYAVDSARGLPESTANIDQFERLGQHLILLFGWGVLGNEADNAIHADGEVIKRLVVDSDLQVRTHAMSFVGRSLREDVADIPQDVIYRFMRLWEFYWNEAGKADMAADPENAMFAYWFGSQAFDFEWSLDNLEAVLKVAPSAGPEHSVIQRLAADCALNPVRSVRMLGLVVDGDEEGWRLTAYEDELRTILEVGMKAGGEARSVAEQVIDTLGRRGFMSFGELLDPPVKLK